MKLKDLFPKQFDFFTMFNTLAAKVEESVKLFSEMLTHPGASELYAEKIHQLEEDADKIVHSTIEKLHQTFITPMDRNNIHMLLLRVDDLIDLIHAASQRVYLYEMRTISVDILKLCELARSSVETCVLLIQSLNNLKNLGELKRLCISINQIENTADGMMRLAIVNLFASETDFKSFIKQKELIEILEALTDKGEAVAHLVESVLLEQA